MFNSALLLNFLLARRNTTLRHIDRWMFVSLLFEAATEWILDCETETIRFVTKIAKILMCGDLFNMLHQHYAFSVPSSTIIRTWFTDFKRRFGWSAASLCFVRIQNVNFVRLINSFAMPTKHTKTDSNDAIIWYMACSDWYLPVHWMTMRHIFYWRFARFSDSDISVFVYMLIEHSARQFQVLQHMTGDVNVVDEPVIRRRVCIGLPANTKYFFSANNHISSINCSINFASGSPAGGCTYNSRFCRIDQCEGKWK